MALMPGSLARDAADGSANMGDQRGFPVVGDPDIGAYEAGTLNSNFSAFIWETLSSTNAAEHDAAFDYDGDGASNIDEWLAGTDPTAASSVLRAAITRAGTNVVVTFHTVTNRTYTLLSAGRLADVFTNTGQPTVFGNGSPHTFTNALPNTPHHFFKVQALR